MKKKEELIHKIAGIFRQIEIREAKFDRLIQSDDIRKAKRELDRLKAEYNEIAKDIHLYLFT